MPYVVEMIQYSALKSTEQGTSTAKDQSGRTSVIHERPSTICQSCWDDVFSAQLGLLAKPLLRTGTDEPPSGGYSCKSTWEDLESQAAGGCQWCQFIVRVKNEGSPSAEDPFNIIVGIRSQNRYLGSPKDTQVLCVFINSFPSFEGYLYADADDPAAEYIIARSRIVDVGSSQALALARRHLEDCIHSHEHCFPPVEPAPLLPTRVVDCSDPNRPRLVATGGLRGSYTALSYVWGEAQPHSTTKANVNAYTDGIDPAHLSQTILDAIHTTRALGLQYLWVDSLCIIQDSEEDKLLEIARMGHIYRDTFVTIIAASAPRVSAGFLKARPPVPPADFPPDIDMPFVCSPASGPDGCEKTRVGKVRISPVSLYTESDDTFDQWWDYFPEMEPVHERAWCMQEYAMSPRALVFASHTVQFHCRTGGIQNVGGSYNDHPDRDSLLPETFFLQETSSTVVHGSSAWKSVRHAWHVAVEGYTRRSLTKPEDKLVAFGGVAEAFQRVLGGDYLAGLWRDTLLSDLLWQKYADMDMERPKGYRAPSWSWAAVDGSVMPGRFFGGALRAGKPLAEIVHCEVDLKYIEHPFGEVTGGILVLRAPFEQCMWNIQTSNRLYRICETPLENHLQPSDQAGKEGSQQEWIGTGYIDSKDDEDVHNVWAVPVHRNADEVEGIIVAQAGKGGPEIHKVVKYRRIGYFDSRDMAGSASWLDAVQVVEIAIV